MFLLTWSFHVFFSQAYSVGISQSEPSSVPQTVVDSFKEMRRARPNECLKSVVKVGILIVVSNITCNMVQIQEIEQLFKRIFELIYICMANFALIPDLGDY